MIASSPLSSRTFVCTFCALVIALAMPNTGSVSEIDSYDSLVTLPQLMPAEGRFKFDINHVLDHEGVALREKVLHVWTEEGYSQYLYVIPEVVIRADTIMVTLKGLWYGREYDSSDLEFSVSLGEHKLSAHGYWLFVPDRGNYELFFSYRAKTDHYRVIGGKEIDIQPVATEFTTKSTAREYQKAYDEAR